ncbi:MAG: hypothetical protein E6R03_01295, partial [Hyphomicrobiaceae bacterium]
MTPMEQELERQRQALANAIPMENFMRPDGTLDFNAYDAALRGNITANVNNNYNALQNVTNPYVQVSGTVKGAPGVSLRKSDYDTELAKYQAQNPNANTSDPNFGVTFANWLRNNNAPITMQSGQVLPGTYLGQTSPGLGISNAEAVKQSQAFIDAENAAKFKPGKAITNLSRGLVLSGLGASALGGLGFGPLSGAVETGVSAGNAGSSFGSNLLSNFATNTALKGALSGAAGGYSSDGISGALKGAALGGLTGGFGNSIAGGLGITSAPG